MSKEKLYKVYFGTQWIEIWAGGISHAKRNAIMMRETLLMREFHVTNVVRV